MRYNSSYGRPKLKPADKPMHHKKQNHEIYPNNNPQLPTIKLSKKKKNCIIYKILVFLKLYKSSSNNTKKKWEREKKRADDFVVVVAIEVAWNRRYCLGSQELMGLVFLGSHVKELGRFGSGFTTTRAFAASAATATEIRGLGSWGFSLWELWVFCRELLFLDFRILVETMSFRERFLFYV